MTTNGDAIRLGTQIDVPVEIGLPHFIQDDHVDEDGPLYGNFKLSLQSVVCHRGTSVNSGHYIALVRGTNTMAEKAAGSAVVQDSKHWMRFDDLASKRITLTNIEQALKEETPYLLFYQIVPVDGDPGRITEGEQPPVYAGSDAQDSGVAGVSTTSLSLTSTHEDVLSSGRPSVDIAAPDSPRGRSKDVETRRPSVTFAQLPRMSEEANASTQKFGLPPSRPSSQTRRASSHGRSGSQGSDVLIRSLSKLSLSGKKSKEALSPDTTGNAQVMVREIANTKIETAQLPPLSRKEQKREKSKNRLSRVSGIGGKSKTEKPDRECSVM